MEFFKKRNHNVEQVKKQFGDELIEAAAGYNEAFLGRLDDAESLDDVERVIEDFALGTPDGTFVVFQIFTDAEGKIEGFSPEKRDLLRGVQRIKEEPPLLDEHLEAKVRTLVDHRDIVDAIVRILRSPTVYEEASN